MDRRQALRLIGMGAVATASGFLMPDGELWTPGRKAISIPKTPTAVAKIIDRNGGVLKTVRLDNVSWDGVVLDASDVMVPYGEICGRAAGIVVETNLDCWHQHLVSDFRDNPIDASSGDFTIAWSARGVLRA